MDDTFEHVIGKSEKVEKELYVDEACYFCLVFVPEFSLEVQCQIALTKTKT